MQTGFLEFYTGLCNPLGNSEYLLNKIKTRRAFSTLTIVLKSFVRRWLKKVRKKRQTQIFHFLKDVAANGHIVKAQVFNMRLVRLQKCWRRFYKRRTTVNALMNKQWSKLEPIINNLKSLPPEEINIEKHFKKIPTSDFGAHKETGIKARKMYFDVFYQIKKYQYLTQVVEYKKNIQNDRKNNSSLYAILDAHRALFGDNEEWNELQSPPRPYIRLIIPKSILKNMIHEVLVYLIHTKSPVSKLPFLNSLKEKLTSVKIRYFEKIKRCVDEEEFNNEDLNNRIVQ
ncbi:unnamed protein product [Moneuplotes crassus]|uniref:Uncharacterized protein n=1 Tax=Euplotes crassus TaxID=5936 RepID=A0AAD1X6E1_EUPCR|nr:unnamed protein product [Moneuplotes crassus]